MTKPLYNKPSLSVSDQINLLKSEGLSFKDENKAKHLLQNISLFRIKSYLIPLRVQDQHTFKQGVFFEDAYSLYKFDAELRKAICSELEKIEISIRTQMSLIMSDHGGIYWFADVNNFSKPNNHAKILASLNAELIRSDDEVIVGFKNTYSNNFPPSWMTFEVSSFGTLSMMYRCLKAGLAKRKVAQFYGLSDRVLESWLHSIVYLRNICAHHSRLWNRKLSINALVPRKTKLPFISIPKDTKKVYYVLSIILYFLQTVNPQNTFVARFRQLLGKYPNVDMRAMGFPENWENEVLWSN
ncbi:MAG: Abi family protein [Muribaculaceae bacterium]|nr:Abi family protein [Muribaculaceae bacterium]